MNSVKILKYSKKILWILASFSPVEKTDVYIQRSVFFNPGLNDRPMAPSLSYFEMKVVSFITVGLQIFLAAFLSPPISLFCDMSGYTSSTDFIVSQFLNDGDNMFLGYFNMVCNTFLCDSAAVILNKTVDEFAMFIVFCSDRTSAVCYQQLWLFQVRNYETLLLINWQ